LTRPFLALLLVLAFTTAPTKTPAAEAMKHDPVVDSLPPQMLVYLNARLSLRDDKPKDVVRWWLLHNALTSRGDAVTAQESDFRSLMWVALADIGLCHDGMRADDDKRGVGLWPLALHNWLNKGSARQPAPPQPRAFTSFSSGMQQRLFGVHHVLSKDELRRLRFFRRDCRRPYMALAELQTPHWLDLDDRLSRGIMMRDLIEKSKTTLDVKRVRGLALLETRLFDLDLALVKLAKMKARRESGTWAQVARATGVSESAITLQRDVRLASIRTAQLSAFLQRSMLWPVGEWRSLSLHRQIALYRQALELHAGDALFDRRARATLLENIDAALDDDDGEALTLWLGFAAPDPATGVSDLTEAIAQGKRGERLLQLTVDNGFREQAPLALRRGTYALRDGRNLDAMRLFASAMHKADDSRVGELTHNLAKRWFAYVLAQHEASDEVLHIVSAFSSSTDKNDLLEVLLWRAAFHVDGKSFEKVVGHIRPGSALDTRVRLLRHLAMGKPDVMGRVLQREYAKRPNGMTQFWRRLTSELSTEPLDVRMKNRPTLEVGQQLLLDVRSKARRGLQKRIDAERTRMQALLDSLQAYDDSAEGKARAAAPAAESFAGAVRLAPADPMPWPFPVSQVQAPSPFSPLVLTPEEWIHDGKRVFGWHIHER